ncbi:uncharacterized protein LACBIDRAFT_245639 [Laccaria bicolor S238N-H82]|uniref:Predicted protein n=1 Tax=Laccaria bicolor (strain S238N-H82 / ATCC MYA-4686) TaxID=486041 RepID=B0CV18_LACBS|nr:uncharacterized protein LACBIDRAFT_245639 [Laccaria bicolor S238N-H82]EDR13251.1 predicted protein [Laccaria bicolor S238N-H82]|eukprot:XP_001875749.1 predicted protein [Laccaria bicolor S238N-H82]
MSLIAISEDGHFQEVPVIDLQDIRSDDPILRGALASQVRDACMRVGFFYVSNHGIPEHIIDGVLEMSKRFFALSTESKMKIEHRKTSNFMGYSPLLSGNNDPDNAGDLQEGFEFGWEELDAAPKFHPDESGPMAGANVWPSELELPGFLQCMADRVCSHSAVNLGQAMFPLFALALNQTEDFFDNKATLMKLLHYPPQTETVDERVIGIGAHTDWECFTILWQQPDLQALQVLNSDKKWINAPPIPGTLVINLGDQFARWTNDIFKSTVHRAINRSGVRRYSIPLFFGTDYNVKLEPIPSCVSPDRPLKYEVITAGEYVKSRLQATYNH